MKLLNKTNIIRIIVIGICLAIIIQHGMPRKDKTGFNVDRFGKLVVQEGGRVKPLDTVARNRLMMMSGKQSLKEKENKIDAVAVVWLMDVVMRPEVANDYKVFRIDNADVLGLFGWQQVREKHFSYNELQPYLEEIFKQAAHINPDREHRTVFEQQIDKLSESLMAYNQLMASFSSAGRPDLLEQEYAVWLASIDSGMEAIRAKELGNEYDVDALNRFIDMADRYLELAKWVDIGVQPPIEGQHWENVGKALLDIIITRHFPAIVADYASLMMAYREQNVGKFNEIVNKIHQELNNYNKNLNNTNQANNDYINFFKINFEVFFNHLEPFYISSLFYILVFLTICIYWINKNNDIRKIALIILAIAFIIHSFGLIGRMYIQGRPPVTNLYSSAIFIGWASVVFGWIMELVHKNGIGAAVAGVIGFGTLVIAHNLSIGGDTLEMVRAVLDSNFWLSTHVVVITMGYSAMFLMGILGIFYIFGNLRKGGMDPQLNHQLSSMIFGTLCFATLFSFVGTMLGGIWADQSWGRFWGWDPKENGALLIVLWCAIMLHARWGKLVQDRGLMIMAVFGNIITSWSWFGTNMLGVGLHSYGFMDKAFLALMVFIVSQFVIMGIGMVGGGLRVREK